MHHGHASVTVPPKSAWGTCDRCGFTYNLCDLRFQYEYRGTSLINTNLRVCPKCMDVPFMLNKPIRMRADPLPVNQPRLNMALIGGEVGLNDAGVPVMVGGSFIPVDDIELED